ncbi:hypothetical protein [Spirochaeta cellobiosiphila]|uniref:hypothetical protein n=1 Tax=Spirochaeta cellobiosiphila TaxID=504483 RepID=UPI0004219C07|nr:hypothetical protein [Spirochaeta cellobiosiphila]
MNNTGIKAWWTGFTQKHPTIAQFIVFFILSNGVTLLQMLMMPLLKSIFEGTGLVHTSFQIWPIGHNLDGSLYYIFNYPAGSIANGGGGGLAYFLAVEITLAIAQIINFFAQRNITFKSNNNIWKSAFWYFIAWIVITILAAALQGLYKAPIYNLLMNTLGLGSAGEAMADFITMIINAAISFWVFFPIFKIIFKEKEA